MLDGAGSLSSYDGARFGFAWYGLIQKRQNIFLILRHVSAMYKATL